MAVTGQKRFIAGAICPSCNQMDTVVVYQEDDQPVRECVRCSYREGASWGDSPAAELPTRVDKDSAGDDVQVVRIIGPSDNHKD